MDIETTRFLKSFSLHAMRIMFYDEEYFISGAVGTNNRARDALHKLAKKVEISPQKYSSLLLDLMNDGVAKKRKAAAEICLYAFIHEEKAISTLKELANVEGVAQGTRIDIMFTIGTHKKIKKQREEMAIYDSLKDKGIFPITTFLFQTAWKIKDLSYVFDCLVRANQVIAVVSMMNLQKKYVDHYPSLIYDYDEEISLNDNSRKSIAEAEKYVADYVSCNEEDGYAAIVLKEFLK